MKKTDLWKRVVLINALVAVSVVSVFAWFIMSDVASVNSLSSDVSDAGYIKVSQDAGESWQNGIDEVDLGTMRILTEISGDGETFFEPLYGEEGIEGFSPVKSSDGKYIEKSFIFETDTTQDVYLTSESVVFPKDTEVNTSADGNFSRDYIAGAIRVAFFEVTDEGEELRYIWVPNPKVEFTGSSVDSDGDVEESYTYQSGTELDQIQSVFTNGDDSGMSGKFLWGDPETDGAVPLISLTTENKAPVRGELLVRVWLEGTDRECVKGLHNGRFGINFKFDKLIGKE